MKVIILAGGSGTRLWPISRNNYPKQFLKLKGMDKSIFQKSFQRCLKLSTIEEVYIVTNINYKFLVMGQIEEMGYKFNENNILIEPVAKNTLPAIYFGVKEIIKKGDDVIAVFPSDHMIENEEQFIIEIRKGLELTDNYIITYGIKPDSPNTGFGYIKPDREVFGGFKVMEFKEKPDYNTACEYVRDGYFWNAGMFMFDSKLFIEEIVEHSPEIFHAFDSNDTKIAFEKTPKISIDYGIMEKSDRVAVIPMDVGWNDLGSFDTFYDVFEKDDNGNVSFNNEVILDSNNNLLYTDGSKAVAIVGVDDLIVVEEKDALLICKKENSQRVKDVTDILKSRKDVRVDYHVSSYRPWGFYQILEEASFHKIKKISVFPKKRLSYQMHHHRSEHWVVVKGMAKVTIEGEEKFVRSGESIFVKSGFKHRLENPGEIMLEIIEVQLGEYLAEDDIIRFEDDFGRN